MDLSARSTRKPVGDSVFWNDTKHPERVSEDSNRVRSYFFFFGVPANPSLEFFSKKSLSTRADPFRNSVQNRPLLKTESLHADFCIGVRRGARTGNGESPWPKLQQVVCSPSTLEYVTVVHKIVLIVVCFGPDVFLQLVPRSQF